MHIPRLSQPTDFERQHISQATSIERRWYAGEQTYDDRSQVFAGYEAGELVIVDPNANIQPIMRLMTGRTGRFRMLTPLAKHRLDELSSCWRHLVHKRGLGDAGSLRLAVTSMIRTTEQQQFLIADGALATEDSVHTYGGAFDIDAAGYYRLDHDGPGGAVSVPHPDRPQIEVDGANPQLSRQPRPELFDERVIESLFDTARLFAGSRAVNVVVEFAGTINQCLHIAANPSVKP